MHRFCDRYDSVEPPRANLAMSLKLIEAILKEQEEALGKAQRCHSQMTRLIKEYFQEHHYAEH